MAMKKRIVLLMAVIILALGACTGGTVALTETAYTAEPTTATVVETSTAASDVQTVEDTSTQETVTTVYTAVSVEYDSEDLEPTVSSAEMVSIELLGDSISVQGTGAMAEGSVVTITAAGTYRISGTLNNGQIIVDTEDEETVYLVLDGADITCATSAPIYVANADKTVITLADGAENYVTDGESYVLVDAETDEPNAAIFSHDDLTINGDGSLIVNANYNNGIASRDDLKITGGTITVNAVNDGIKGRDSIAVKDGTIIVTAGADGLQSTNDEDSEKGTIAIEGGTLDITAGLDGIQAQTNLLVSGGEITIVSGGGSVQTSSNGGRGMESSASQSIDSAKGLKASTDLTILDGVIQISSLDDPVHSNGSITISGGELVLATGGDGVHADSALTINDGELNLAQSYEGLESLVITVNGGTIFLTASDDGINAAGGNNPTSGGGQFESGDGYVYINGGYIVIDAGGDGLDSNGSVEMTNGTVIINGPTNDGNGPLDYLGTFNISGGCLLAVGSSGMAEAPSSSSSQYSVMYNYDSTQAAGTMVHIESESGEDVLTFVPTKQYQSVLLSSPELENGTTYVVYSGGSASGTPIDGLYSGGTYTGGTQVASLTITSMVTTAGSAVGGMGGKPGGRP